jgi:hypothetical protein
VELGLDWASSMAMEMSRGGVRGLGRSLQGGVGLGGHQDGVHPLGVVNGVGGRSKGEGEGSGRVAASGSSSPSSPTEKRQQQKNSKIS